MQHYWWQSQSYQTIYGDGAIYGIYKSDYKFLGWHGRIRVGWYVDWINWGELPPTMKTPGIAWWLNGVGLLFWLIAFVILEIKSE